LGSILVGPPLPSRNYGPEDINRPQPKRRKKKQKELDNNAPTTSVLSVEMPAVKHDNELVLTVVSLVFSFVCPSREKMSVWWLQVV